MESDGWRVMAHQAQELSWQEPAFLPELTLAQEKENHNIFAALQNSCFFSGSQFHIIWRKRQALVLTLDVSLGQLQRRLCHLQPFKEATRA